MGILVVIIEDEVVIICAYVSQGRNKLSDIDWKRFIEMIIFFALTLRFGNNYRSCS